MERKKEKKKSNTATQILACLRDVNSLRVIKGLMSYGGLDKWLEM